MKRKKAFTLIEILVVIAIIGILATISAVWYLNAQQKARDQHRISIANDIKQALELYYDKYKTYPVSNNCGVDIPGFTYKACSSNNISGGRWITKDAKFAEFLDNEPVDPKPSSPAQFGKPGTFYYYQINGNAYMLIFALENKDHYTGEDGVRPGLKAGGLGAGAASILCCRDDQTRMFLFSTDATYSNVVTLGNNRGTVAQCNNPTDNPPTVSNFCPVP